MTNYECAKKQPAKIPAENIDHQASRQTVLPSKSGYIQLSLDFAVSAAAVFFFAFDSSFFERYVDDWPRN